MATTIFAINLQVPAGRRHFSLVLYYKIEAVFMEVIPSLNIKLEDLRTVYLGSYDGKFCVL